MCYVTFRYYSCFYMISFFIFERKTHKAKSGNLCLAFTITRVDTQDHHNRKLHHTDQYKSKALILRRGQDFILDVYPSTSFDNSNYKFYIELWTGSKPREFDRTLIKIRMVKYLERKRWGMKRTGTHDTKIQLKINIPSTCIIGKYQMRILNMNDKVIYRHEEPLFMLFNPWSTGELDVYSRGIQNASSKVYFYIDKIKRFQVKLLP